VKIKPFELHQAQDLVKDAVQRADRRHNRWRVLEALYRTGNLQQAQEVTAGKLAEYLPSLTEHAANMVLPHINIIQESVIARDPKLICEPIGGGEIAELTRATSEGVLTYFWKRASATEHLRDATIDAVRLGSGFVKTAWTHTEVERELDDDERGMRLDSLVEEELEAARREFRMAEIEPLEKSVPYTETLVIRSEPFVEYVSPYDVFVPVNTRRIQDARWVAQRLTLPVDEILANPEYDITEEELVRDTATINEADMFQAEWRRQTEDSRGVYGSSLALDTATIWEFYDMRTRRMMVFQLDNDKVLWEDAIPWSHRYPPFVHIRNYTATGSDFWGFGDIENIASLQDMMNEFFSEQMNNARRAGQKYLVRSNSVSDELRAALESDEGDVVAAVNIPSGEPLSDVVVPVFRAALSNDIYAAKAEVEDKIRQVLGINDFQAGGLGADRMSATAAAVVDGVATLRAQSKIASVEAAASQIGNLILLLCQEYLDQPTAVRIAGVSGASWSEVSKGDIWGEFRVSVEGGSTRAINPATREQQGLRTLGDVVPALLQLGYDPEPALRSALRDLGYDPDLILVRAQQPAMPAGPGPMPAGAPAEGGAPMASEQMMAMGGPPLPAEMQGRGGLGV
jgi:hypothetical protein